MERGWSVRPERVEMERGPVAFVPIEAVGGKEPMVKLHQTIASHFGDDGRAGDGVTRPVTADDRPAREVNGGNVAAIHEHQLRRDGQICHGLRHRLQGGLADVVGIDRVGGDDPDADDRLLEDDVIGERSLARAEALGIIDPHREEASGGEDDGRSDDRTGPRAAPRLIDAGDRATARESRASVSESRDNQLHLSSKKR